MNTIEFCIKNGYYVDVKKIDNGMSAKFPQSIIYNYRIPEQENYYLMIDDVFEIYHKANNSNKLLLSEKVDNYMVSCSILADMAIHIGKMNISSELVQFDKSVGETFIEFIKNSLKYDLTKEDEVKEVNLNNILAKIMLGRPCAKIAEELNIIDGHDFIVSYLEKMRSAE